MPHRVDNQVDPVILELVDDVNIPIILANLADRFDVEAVLFQEVRGPLRCKKPVANQGKALRQRQNRLLIVIFNRQ